MSLNIESLFYSNDINSKSLSPRKSKSKLAYSAYAKSAYPVKSFYLRNKLACKIVVAFLYFFIGTAVICSIEKWTVIEGLYFIIVTTFTIGYGYFHPTHDSSKLFIIFYMIFGTTVILSFLVTFSTTVVHGACDEVIMIFLRWRGATEPPKEKYMTKYRSIFCISFLIIAALSGTLVFSGIEGWPYIDGLYFSIATMTTVGYGDYYLTEDTTLIFGMIFIICSCSILTVTVGNIVNDYIDNIHRGQLRRSLQTLSTEKFGQSWMRRLFCEDKVDVLSASRETATDISEVSSPATKPVTTHPQRSECSKERFALFVLAELGIIDYSRDIQPLFRKFKELDRDNKGGLSRQDLSIFLMDIEALSQGAKVLGEEIGYRAAPSEVKNPLHSSSEYINIGDSRCSAMNSAAADTHSAVNISIGS